MSVFPSLSSGAVTQYPTGYTTGQGVQAIRFLDGSDQRYCTQRQMLRQWAIRLDLLNDTEIAQIEAFFNEQLGDYSTFDFPDPISDVIVANCRFAAPSLVSAYLGTDVGSVSLVVMETYG